MATRVALLVASLGFYARPMQGENFATAAKATNQFGLDLYRKMAAGETDNLCLSPYSISCALAMALDGAEGETHREMVGVLHLEPQTESDPSFAALQKSLAEIGPETAKIAEESRKNGGPSDPITIAVANRLFAQAGYKFRPQFFAQVRDRFGAAPEVLDFKRNANAATKKINDWVARQTHDRIRDLIP